ncbi:MAG TPA: TolC family outer membrane protein [Rhodocyclaceae bacterium]|nr:TolC family outer membrane protein [Rhodocyclaceae bacterium]
MKRISWLLGLTFASGSLCAADLVQIYREAQANDPTFAAARSTREAGHEREPQGLSGLLPNVALSGNSTWNDNEIRFRSGAFPPAKPKYNSNGYTLSLSQPLFRWQNWVAYGQSKLQVAQAEANFVQAQQDLVLRVAQAYFDLLYANENLAAVRANKTAIEQQLESAKKNFEVGTATITDTHEAQSRFDLAVAQELAAENDLEVKRRTLQSIIGKVPEALAPLKSTVALTTPEPASMDKWVQAAERDSTSVQIQQAAADIAAKEVERQRAGHYPTVDLVAAKGRSNNFASTAFGMTETDFQNVGVQLNLPLYQGGVVNSRTREAAANRGAALSSLEAARRSAALAARQYYLGVVNGLAQVKALDAALASSQLALESNRLGYEVGVRINIDVLNAEQQVYVTRRDLAKAKYDTLLAQLRLKAAVGALGEDDVQQINGLLDPAAAK